MFVKALCDTQAPTEIILIIKPPRELELSQVLEFVNVGRIVGFFPVVGADCNTSVWVSPGLITLIYQWVAVCVVMGDNFSLFIWFLQLLQHLYNTDCCFRNIKTNNQQTN